MTRKQATIPLGIIVSQTSSGSFGEHYMHLTGRFVTLIDGKVRNMCSQVDPINGSLHRIDDLQVTAFGESSHKERGVYAFDVRYQDVYSVEMNDAEKMLKTLQVIWKRLRAMSEVRGESKSFGEFVGRVAEATKTTQIMECVSPGSFHNETEYRYRDVGDGVRWIDSMVEAWQNPKAEQKEAING